MNPVNVHSGEALNEFLADYGLSQSQLARELRVPVRRINTIVRGERQRGSLMLVREVREKRDVESGEHKNQRTDPFPEQTWKMMKRWLEMNVGAVEVDGVTRRQLFRLCHENRLIDDVDVWMDFHKSRNETSPTYNQSTAENVFKVAGEFLPAASDVLSRIAARND